MTLLALIAVAIFSAKLADYGANKIFTHARPPTHGELPHTATAIPYSSDDVQVLGGQGRELSCSIPWSLERAVFPPKRGHASTSLRMRQACAFHDYCYRHGAATYGYGQADCDYLLMEHAYRLCRFLNPLERISNCIIEARKVALGVRLGGSDSFKRADDTRQSPTERRPEECAVDAKLQLLDDHCTSSYFEFDPYPIRSTQYVVYRIADAPQSWVASGAREKALYVFRIRPSGVQITIVGWSSDATVCAGYRVPGNVAYLNVPPRVVRVEASAGSGEDWFVWWRRRSLDQTGGKLAILSPRRAGPKDWVDLFPGTMSFNPTRCTVLAAGASAASSTRAWREVYVGEKSADDDANFSDIYSAPGLGQKDRLLLMTLRSHGCGNPSRTCYHEIQIDPDGGADRITLEPYKIRDGIYAQRKKPLKRVRGRQAKPDPSQQIAAWEQGEPDRYRNYVTPPISVMGPNGPALAWLRRGEELGETYTEAALLRRAYRVGTDGKGFGLVLLRDFPEAADPVFVLGRTSERPRLHALMANGDHTLTLKAWRLPPPILAADKPRFEPDGRCETQAPTGFLNSHAQAAVCPRTIAKGSRVAQSRRASHRTVRRLNPGAPSASGATACMNGLDDTWLIRPPVVLASTSGSGTIIFTRFKAKPHPSNQRALRLGFETRVAQLAEDGACRLGAAHAFDLDIEMEKNPEKSAAGEGESGKQGKETKRTEIANLRARPVLATRLNDDAGYSLIVPDPEMPGRSVIVTLPP